MSNHSVIEHRANYHFFKLEEDYVQICQGGEQYPQCKAAILAVLEHWINDKKTKGQDVYIYMTYPEWIDALYGLFRRSHILACLNELVSDKLILRRPCRRGGKDSYEYTLNVGIIQEKIKQLPERTDKNTRPNLNASKFKRVQKQTGVNLNGNTRPNLNASSSDASKNKRNIDSLTEIPSSDRDSQREGEFANAHSSHASDNLSEDHSFEDEETVERPAIKLNGASLKHTSSQARAGEHERTDGAATGSSGGEPRASGKQEKPKRGRKQPQAVHLTLHEQEIKQWYEELRGIEVSFSKRNVAALQALGKRTMTKDDFLNVTAILDGDKWFEEHKIGVDLYWIDRQWENKIIFLQNHKKPGLADKKPRKRPRPEDKNISIFEYDPSWQVWKRQGEDQEWIWWQGEFWTPEEADERGYDGGAGLYVGHAQLQQELQRYREAKQHD
jgi:hypothetical protein